MRTYDPYDEVTRPAVGIFAGLPSAPPGTVLVIDREGKPLRVLASHSDRLTAGEARFGRIRTIYRVVVAERQLEIGDSYPCRDAGTFTATLLLTCRVVDPAAVVQRVVHDVASVLVPRVTETLRALCRTFPAEDYADAEVAALAAVRGKEAESPYDAAFRISDVSLALTLDEDAERFVRKIKDNARTSVLMRSDTVLATEKADQEAALNRQRQELLAQQDALQAQHQQAMARLEADLERQRVEAEIERTTLLERSKLELDRARSDHYLGMLSRGDYSVIAMQLAHDPTSIDGVARQLAQRQTTEAQQQLAALQMFLQADALEAMDISDKAKVLLTRLADGWARGTPQLAVPASELLSLPEGPGVTSPSGAGGEGNPAPGSPSTGSGAGVG